jgi:hypothetical protein
MYCRIGPEARCISPVGSIARCLNSDSRPSRPAKPPGSPVTARWENRDSASTNRSLFAMTCFATLFESHGFTAIALETGFPKRHESRTLSAAAPMTTREKPCRPLPPQEAAFLWNAFALTRDAIQRWLRILFQLPPRLHECMSHRKLRSFHRKLRLCRHGSVSRRSGRDVARSARPANVKSGDR